MADTRPAPYEDSGCDEDDVVEDGAIDYQKAQKGARLLLEATGYAPDEEGIRDTWRRRVPAALETLTAGTREAEKPTMRTFEAGEGEVVQKEGIPVYSLCEHHLLPFFGEATVVYEPEGRVVGLSKLTRYVRWQSRQFTMQERLTREIASGLREEINARAVYVELGAVHMCESMRGVESETTTTTSAVAGEFTAERGPSATSP